MANELMPCPVCGGGVTQPGNSDVYCVDCNYKNHVGDHNALARRAEIGRIVEVLAVPGGRRLVLEGDYAKIEPGHVAPPSSFTKGALSLLDALRALEAEVGGRDEPEGGPAL